MLRLENISKYYYSQSGVSLGLHKVNLSFQQGEFVAITGESGSGKSTLLNVISGLDSYEDGELYVDGKPTSHFDDADWEEYRREKIAFIFQNYNLIDSYTVLENVESALLVQGCPKEELRSRALECIKKVDLLNRKNHRASELSSGQKQRLSIARALAKETPIIVADEPTGNLDSDNGEQVMHLLKNLSKEKLVIMVTHNSEQAERYVTRKIILHDGEIIADRDYQKAEAVTSAAEDKSTKVKAGIRENVIARMFAQMNIMSQRGKVFAIVTFMLVSTFASFVFLGSFFSNLDETGTKIYDNSAYFNSSDKRIVARHMDNSPIIEEDLKVFRNTEYVEEVDRYDISNDMYYFYQPGQDYKISYHTNVTPDDPNDAPNGEVVVLTAFNKFIRSATCISEDSLAAGHLPEAYNQVVLYSNDMSKLGEQIVFYFSDQRNWGIDQRISITMTVAGLLKETNPQVYFSEDFCKMMLFNTKLDDHIFIYGSTRRHADMTNAVFTMNEELQPGTIRASNGFLNQHMDDPYHAIGYDQGKEWNIIKCELSKDGTEDTSHVFEISKQDYETILGDLTTTQASLYIKDYAYAGDVIASLKKAGYDAISPIQVSSTKYDPAKVKERLVTLLISIVSLVVISLLEVVIVKSLLKLKKNDFIILRLIGLRQVVIQKINYFEMVFYETCAIVLTIAAVTVLNLNHVTIIVNLVKYYRVQHYCILILFNLLLTLVIACRFNQYLGKHGKVTALNEQ